MCQVSHITDLFTLLIGYQVTCAGKRDGMV